MLPAKICVPGKVSKKVVATWARREKNMGAPLRTALPKIKMEIPGGFLTQGVINFWGPFQKMFKSRTQSQTQAQIFGQKRGFLFLPKWGSLKRESFVIPPYPCEKM